MASLRDLFPGSSAAAAASTSAWSGRPRLRCAYAAKGVLMVAAPLGLSALTPAALRRLKFHAWLAGLVLLLVASITLAVTIGPAEIGAGEVWATIAHRLGLFPESPVSLLREGIVWELRL